MKLLTSKLRPKGEIITAYSKVDEGPGYAEGVTFRRIEVDATNETGVNVSDETVTFAADNVTIEDWSATKDSPDQHSLFANPRFVTDPATRDPATCDPASVPIKLKLDSPAINRGTPIAMHTKLQFVDYFGNPRVGRPDIGAFELQK